MSSAESDGRIGGWRVGEQAGKPFIQATVPYPMIDRLREALSKRGDGYWELLSTAAGSAESVARTTAGLSAESVGSNGHGDAIAPSIVRERVEALAAYSPKVLADLAATWVGPASIGDDPWWTAAWTSALRHLKQLGRVNASDADVPALSSEAAIVWSRPKSEPISWHEVSRKISSRRAFYDDVRALSDEPLAESALSAADLQSAPWQALRLLRGRAERLDPAARLLLTERARSWRDRDPLEAAVTAELCGDSSPAFLDKLRIDVIDALPSISEARRLAPLAYVLVGEWRAP